MKVLVTGGCGFIGCHFVRRLLAAGDEVVNLDKLAYSGNLANVADIADHARYRFVQGCVTDRSVVEPLVRAADAIVHLAAESHVDRSIDNARPFVETNVVGAQALLEALARDPSSDSKRLVHVSTDEVFGDLPIEDRTQAFSESSRYAPSSPYAASKAASDHLVRAYVRTFGIDACIATSSNNFGPYQHPEKVIPLFTTRLIDGRRMPMYGDGRNVRDWIHVLDHCEALETILRRGRAGQSYNIGAGNERSNLELATALATEFGGDEQMIEFVADRPGHDRRYAIDSSKIRTELGWSPTRSLWPAALVETVAWYRANESWWRPLVD